jgi:hypothetical protein
MNLSVLLADSGPRNPLYFFALCLAGRVPDAVFSETDTLEQLETVHGLLCEASPAVFRYNSLAGPVAVLCDALLALASADSHKSPRLRIKALETLTLLARGLCEDINSLAPVLPGVLSRLVKLVSGRVDVEVDEILLRSLELIHCLIGYFWRNLDQWKAKEEAERSQYKNNAELVMVSLRPLIRSLKNKSCEIQDTCMALFQQHLCLAPPDLEPIRSVSLFLIATGFLGRDANIVRPRLPEHVNDLLVKRYEYLIETIRDLPKEELSKQHELIVLEWVQELSGILCIDNSIGIADDLLEVIIRLTRVQQLELGDSVSMEYDSDNVVGLDSLPRKAAFTVLPRVHFRHVLKMSKDLKRDLGFLRDKAVELDGARLTARILYEIEGLEDCDELVQRLELLSELPSLPEQKGVADALVQVYSRLASSFSIEQGSLVHLALLKAFSALRFVRPMLVPVLSGMASDWSLLSEFSTRLLQYQAACSSHTLSEFLCMHQEYLIDRLGGRLELPHMYPETPRIIHALLKGSAIDPSFMLSCTDLLVRRVNMDLAAYQSYPSYALDLLKIVEGTCEALQTMEPRYPIDVRKFVYATGMEAPEEEDSASASERLSIQQQAAVDLLSVAHHFVGSDSKKVRIAAFKAMTAATRHFPSESSAMCQVIHKAWPLMMAVLREALGSGSMIHFSQMDRLTIQAESELLTALITTCPRFIRDRFVKDLWRGCLKRGSIALAYSGPNTNSQEAVASLIGVLADSIIRCQLQTEILVEFLDLFSGSRGTLPSIISTSYERLYRAIEIAAPDAAWYRTQVQLGALSSIIPPDLELFESYFDLTAYLTH